MPVYMLEDIMQTLVESTMISFESCLRLAAEGGERQR